VLLGLCLGASRSGGEDWPQLLGPRANGKSGETGLIERWDTNGPVLLWSKDIGTGYSAPSVRDAELVVHHRQRDEEIVEALDAASGAARWRYAYRSEFIDPYGYNNGPRASPLLTADSCFTFGAEGMLVCLDRQTGQLRWRRDTGREWQIPAAFFGVGSSPVLEGDLLLVMIGGQPNSGMAALDRRTGKTVWESVGERNWTGVPMTGWPGNRTVRWADHEKQASYATPVLATLHGRRRALCLMRQGLVCLDPKTGVVDFSFWFRARINDSVNAANPVVWEDTVLISAAYYKVGAVALRVKPDGRSVEEAWRGTALETHWNTPILHDGFVYAFSGRNEPDARFRCVEFKTGAIKWDRDESWPAHSTKTPSVYGRGSLILADGKLIVLGEGGRLGIFKAQPTAAEQLAAFQVPMLEYPCWAGPVLSAGRLYLRSENKLLCYDFKAEGVSAKSAPSTQP
jgi:outer membrane protein assembly factor BamB